MRKPDDYLKAPYARILIPDEDGGFFAEILEFPGCVSEGETADEAIRNLENAGTAWIEAALSQGQEIPAPSLNEGFSGRVALRLPRSLHRQAVRMAERDRTSLNQYLITAIAARTGAEELYRRMVDEACKLMLEHVQQTLVVNISGPLTFAFHVGQGVTAATLAVGSVPPTEFKSGTSSATGMVAGSAMTALPMGARNG